VYEAPFRIAKSLFLSTFPSLGAGDLPSAAFLIDMPIAFERFVDGLVHLVVKKAAQKGNSWRASYQQPFRFADPLSDGDDAYHVRPDNCVWEIQSSTTSSKRGVTIDAKYKGSGSSSVRPEKPNRSDMYQVVASCLASGYRTGIIVAPALDRAESRVVKRWNVRSQDPKTGICVGSVKVDLAALRTMAEIARTVTRFQEAVEEQLVYA
jgi:5-methylcytosine-specific restriction endonuclease McrBC regulatory subunit McrC